MNTLSDQDLERLDRFLRNELSPQEQAEVALLISEKTEWRDAYQSLRSTQKAGRQIFHREMRARFAQTDAGSGNFRALRLIAVAAASIALMISAVLWLLPSRDADLIAEYRTFPNIVLPIEKSGSEFTDRERAYQAYELGEYKTAIQRFSGLQDPETADSIYLALSYLELGTYRPAQAILQSIRNSQDVRWSQVAEWYEMWLYVKTDRKGVAMAILERISSTSGHRYENQASELLAKHK